MGADPHPNEFVAILDREGAIVPPNSDRPVTARLLEPKRGMSWVFLEAIKVAVGGALD